MKTFIIILISMLLSVSVYAQSNPRTPRQERKYQRYLRGNAVTYDNYGTHYTVFRRSSAVTYSVPNRSRSTRSYSRPNVSYTIIRK